MVFFLYEINFLNGICFAAQLSNDILTINQKFIFTNILDLICADVKKI